jgi:nucleoside-diphosphate-sugar epimerase
MRELAQMIYEEAQEAGLLPRTDAPLGFEPQPIFHDDVKIRVPDITKAQRVLGFTPTKNARESVRACLGEHQAQVPQA